MKYFIYSNKEELIKRWSSSENTVLDIGYYGQNTGKKYEENNSPHGLIKKGNKETYGLDLEGEEDDHYIRGSAEQIPLDKKFDSIFALDLIEHLSNPGLFLESCSKHLQKDGILVITTPNCYGLFNMAGKITNYEPVVNKQHTCYYNLRTIKQLASRFPFSIEEIAYIRDMGCDHTESFKKKILNILDYALSLVTTKYMETLVIVLKVEEMK